MCFTSKQKHWLKTTTAVLFIPKNQPQRLVGFLQRPRFGTTLLGCVPGNEQVSVEWTFTNTSPEAWPVGCRLRYLGGNVKPIYTSKSTTEVVLPRGTNNQTPACFFFFGFQPVDIGGIFMECHNGVSLRGFLAW